VLDDCVGNMVHGRDLSLVVLSLTHPLAAGMLHLEALWPSCNGASRPASARKTTEGFRLGWAGRRTGGRKESRRSPLRSHKTRNRSLGGGGFELVWSNAGPLHSAKRARFARSQRFSPPPGDLVKRLRSFEAVPRYLFTHLREASGTHREFACTLITSRRLICQARMRY
jgi:hypothetical protein